MSGVQITEYVPLARFPAGHQVIELPSLHVVDYFNTRSAAEYAARQLNAGAALIDPHAVVGCKVVAA